MPWHPPQQPWQAQQPWPPQQPQDTGPGQQPWQAPQTWESPHAGTQHQPWQPPQPWQGPPLWPGQPPWTGLPPWAGPPAYIQPKNPAVAVIASFLLPGLGSMLSGNSGTGTLILCLWALSVLASFILIGIPFLIGLWIWGLIQAHSDAVNWNTSRGIIC